MFDFIYTIVVFPITQIIEVVFVFTQKVFGEIGVSIFAVSGVISVLCLPLYAVAEHWQQVERNTQKYLGAKIKKIKAVFKGDEQYMILSTYYRQNHYHPVYAMRSTFGLLIQIPFFIAAYSYLSHLETLKGAHFLFISDLGAPDALLKIGLGTINVLPILMTLINTASGALYTRGFPFKEKIQLYGMAVLFLILLYNSPAGLVLYWTMNNVFSLAKNLYYKLAVKSKTAIVQTILSAVCFFITFYLLAVYRGNRDARIPAAVSFGLIGIIPWIFPFIKKLFTTLPQIHYSKSNLLIIFTLSFSMLWALVGFFLSTMLIVSSPQEFSNIDSYGTPLAFVANTAVQSFGFFVFWPLCLYFLFSDKTKQILTVCGIAFCFTALCNVFLFSGSYGIISADFVFDNGIDHSLTDILFNIFVLLLISCAAFVAFFLFFRRAHKIIVPIILLPLLAVLGVSGINIFSINKAYQELSIFHKNLHKNHNDAQIEFAASEGDTGNFADVIKPIFHLSKTGQNTIVIMLDRATSAFVPYILAESPDLNKLYDGFTYYPNTVSFNGYTRLGSPPLFGGYEYTPAELNKRDTVPMRDKHNEALLLLPRVFSEADYAVTVTDPPYPNYSYKEDLRIYDPYPEIKAHITDSAYTNFWLKEHQMNLPPQSAILRRNIFWYGFLKILPLAFREGIYQHGGWFAPVSGHKLMSTVNAYAVLDYLPRLTDFVSAKENTAIIMVNNTTHEPSFLQAPEYRPSLNVSDYGTSPFRKETEYHVNIAALKRLADWWTYLKAENAYDNTRIIIVADHGAQLNYVAKTTLPFNLDNFNPLLLVKDFGAAGTLQTDMTFMSNADVPFLALQNQIQPAVNPFTGKEITTDAKSAPLFISISGGIHRGDSQELQIAIDPQKDYYVHDSIFDEANWESATLPQ